MFYYCTDVSLIVSSSYVTEVGLVSQSRPVIFCLRLHLGGNASVSQQRGPVATSVMYCCIPGNKVSFPCVVGEALFPCCIALFCLLPRSGQVQSRCTWLVLTARETTVLKEKILGPPLSLSLCTDVCQLFAFDIPSYSVSVFFVN